MTKVYSKSLDQSLTIDRIIGKVKGKLPGPTLVFLAGIHGNEPSGVFAMNKVCEELRSEHLEIKGNLFAIAGNLWALEKGKRYHQEDLNRIWTSDKTQA